MRWVWYSIEASAYLLWFAVMVARLGWMYVCGFIAVAFVFRALAPPPPQPQHPPPGP